MSTSNVLVIRKDKTWFRSDVADGALHLEVYNPETYRSTTYDRMVFTTGPQSWEVVFFEVGMSLQVVSEVRQDSQR